MSTTGPLTGDIPGVPGSRNKPKVYRSAGRGIKFNIATADGFRAANRPTDSQLDLIRQMRYIGAGPEPNPDDFDNPGEYDEAYRQHHTESTRRARGLYEGLVGQGFDLCPATDWDNHGYDRWLANNRMYGYRWALANLMTHPETIEGHRGDPPVGAILVPQSDAEDPNVEKAEPAPVQAPDPEKPEVAKWGWPISTSMFPEAYSVPPDNTAKRATIGGKVFVVIRGRVSPFDALGTLLWVPEG